MSTFLAILNGAADADDRPQLTEQQHADFMRAWAHWAQTHRHGLSDAGGPLYRKRRVTSHGVESFVDPKVAYVIVEAESHDAATRMFEDHPHLTLAQGNSIEVIESPKMPGP